LHWKSRKLQGLSVRDYAPVVVRGVVLVTTNPVKDFHAILGQHEEMLIKRTGFTGTDKRFIPLAKVEVEKEQAMIVDFLKANPAEQSFYAFQLADGREPWIAPILYTGGMHNPMSPPCYNPNTGEVFTQVRSAYGVWDGGGEVRSFTGFGKLDLKTGRVELLEHGYKHAKAAAQPFGLINEWHGPARAIVSVAGNKVFFPVGSQVLCLEGQE